METPAENRQSWLDRPLLNQIVLNGEIILYILLFLLALFTRFYDLEARVMSHDENTHVYYSWRFMNGQGLAHDPLMHGPFQFHLIALSYFMFGDNDFTARIPAVLFSIATVMFVWYFRRYLGRAGALIAGFLYLISPYMLFYGRYVRNETFVALFGLVMIWAILRYLESGKPGYLYALTAATALHFTAKETAFIYQAQALVFLAFLFIQHITQKPWKHVEQRSRFILALMIALILIGGFAATFFLKGDALALNPEATISPSVPGQEEMHTAAALPSGVQYGLLGASILALVAAAYFLIRGYTWEAIRRERSFGLLMILGTFVLPQLTAFPVRFVGWLVPTNGSQVMGLTTTDMLHIAVFMVPLFLISIAIGMLWNAREWLINAGIFYGLFTIFYTSLFTHGAGFLTGLVGSLGYWLEQQGVNRGSQPNYYYWLIQVPVYEYLPALGAILAFILVALRKVLSLRLPASSGVPTDEYDEDENGDEDTADLPNAPMEKIVPPELESVQKSAPAFSLTTSAADEVWQPAEPLEETPQSDFQPAEEKEESAPALALFAFWAVTSLAAYTIAGEKMPWLTVHITLPLILCAAWFLGKLVDETDWSDFKRPRGWLVLALLPVFGLSLSALLAALLGSQPPFQGQTLEQLQATSTFLTSLLAAVASGAGLFYLVKSWSAGQTARLLTLFVFASLGFLTARTAFQAAYINYDNANELLVYAHSAGGVKTALEQIEEISIRTTDSLDVAVAYDNDTSYPYWWYLRNYPNARYYGADPTRSLRDVPLILVGANNYGKMEPVVANLYHEFEYIRLWWPNQDYFGLTWERVAEAWRNPQMREALFEIWLNRDYTLYGQVTGRDFSLKNWSPADRMRLYIRKDVVESLWNYGAAPSAEVLITDPFEEKGRTLTAEITYGSQGMELGQFQRPRDLAVAPDGSLYVVDTDNHRIQHLSDSGEILQVWGSFGDVTTGSAPGGAFNQPWGIALGPDGAVYVADTWNHRVQKFSPAGEFLTMWGAFGQAETPTAFWGPRDIVVSSDGKVMITDTGNKRVVIFDEQGNFITEFGNAGMNPGEFDEPTGLALGADGKLYVADTWNQRVQVFVPDEAGDYYPFAAWDLSAWYGQSLDNKPYLAVDEQGRVYIADPEGYRILVLSAEGQALYYWGDYGADLSTFGMPASVALDGLGGIWVSDAGNSRLMYFQLPE